MDKQNYVQFLLGPHGISMTTESHWECRTAGLLKIMTRVFENLQEMEVLKKEYTIRINTADGPSKDKRPQGVKNYIEFDTSTEGTDETRVFPDYIFGNWWHIGLRNFDDFSEDIRNNNDTERIKDKRAFWIGATQGVSQRIKYLDLCSKHQDKLCGDQMHWINQGRTPIKFVPIKDKCEFKYLIDLAGQGVSGRLKLLPFCNRPLFITDRRFWAWSDIIIIKEGLHIPVKDDLSDLIEKYDWAEQNQNTVIENSKRLLDFCKENFTFSKVCETATKMVVVEMEKCKQKNKQIGKKIDIVVAHYKENLSWLNRLDHELINKIYVYTKSDLSPKLEGDRFKYMRLLNVGRESHTYLWHCVDQYDQMKNGSSDFVFFLQGSPHGLDDIRVPEWIEEVSKNDLKHTFNFRLSSPYDFLNKGRCSNWGGITNEAANYDVKEWCDKLIKPVDKFKDIPIFWNACFGVSVERILSNNKEKYQRIIEELSTPNPECGHYCERLWYYIFNMDQASNRSVIEDCYDFWGDHNGHRHHGVVRLNKDGTVGFYSHPNESFWKMEDDKIIFMDRQKNATSIMTKVAEGKYEGNFLADPRSVHKLIKLGL